MGKSPGVWLKTILSGKRLSNAKHSSSKRSDPSVLLNRDEVITTSGLIINPASVSLEAQDASASGLIINPASVSLAAQDASAKNGADSNLEERITAKSPHDRVVLQSPKRYENSKAARDSVSPEDSKIITQNQAATKAQAAFRGYLARRAFRALKGIIRLQAYIRGHLVRRQAVATLFCIIGIVKVQALFRGHKIRCSNIGIKVRKNQSLKEDLFCKHPFSVRLSASTQSQKLLNRAFIRQLLAPSFTAMPVCLRYGQSDTNSALDWLDRWTKSCFWKPLMQSYGVLNLKSQTTVGGFQTVGSEQGLSNCHVKGMPSIKVESCTTLSSDTEKTKHKWKASSNSAVSVQGNPQNEVGKAKRNSRKLTSNMSMEISDRVETNAEKPKRALKASSSTCPDALDQVVTDSTGKMEKGASIPRWTDLEASLKSSAADAPVDESQVHAAIDLQRKENNGKNEDVSGIDKELGTKVDSIVHENQKTRRASLSTKQEHKENGSQVMPRVPSYMAATESVKAKLRLHGSPRFVPDESETKSNTRRHSLPASINSKSSSSSPRVQSVALTSSKGGIKNEKSLLSSGEADKVIQPEWRKW